MHHTHVSTTPMYGNVQRTIVPFEFTRSLVAQDQCAWRTNDQKLAIPVDSISMSDLLHELRTRFLNLGFPRSAYLGPWPLFETERGCLLPVQMRLLALSNNCDTRICSATRRPSSLRAPNQPPRDQHFMIRLTARKYCHTLLDARHRILIFRYQNLGSNRSPQSSLVALRPHVGPYISSAPLPPGLDACTT
jgi:hypothetical protein